MSYQIDLAHSEPIHTAVIRGRVRPQELAQFVPAACGEVWSFARSANLPRPGRHLALYLDEQGSVEVGVELSEPFVGNDRVQCSKLPAGRVVTTVHFGPYPLLREAHRAIHRWCRAAASTFGYFVGDGRQSPVAASVSEDQSELRAP